MLSPSTPVRQTSVRIAGRAHPPRLTVLSSLRDQNIVLFYSLCLRHLNERALYFSDCAKELPLNPCAHRSPAHHLHVRPPLSLLVDAATVSSSDALAPAARLSVRLSRSTRRSGVARMACS